MSSERDEHLEKQIESLESDLKDACDKFVFQPVSTPDDYISYDLGAFPSLVKKLEEDDPTLLWVQIDRDMSLLTVIDVLDKLKKNTHVNCLAVFLNLNSHIAGLLIKMLEENKHLRSLSVGCSRSDLEMGDFEKLVTTFNAHPTLKVLALPSFRLNTAHLKHILPLVYRPDSKLTRLGLGGNKFTEHDYELIKRAISCSTHIKSLNILNNNLSSEFARTMQTQILNHAGRAVDILHR